MARSTLTGRQDRAGKRPRAVAIAGVTALALLATATPAVAGNNLPVGQHDEQITFHEWSKHPELPTETAEKK